MSLPRDLDEVPESELRAELRKRRQYQKQGRCDYCGGVAGSPACKLPTRHKNAGAVSVVIDPDSVVLTEEEHALANLLNVIIENNLVMRRKPPNAPEVRYAVLSLNLAERLLLAARMAHSVQGIDFPYDPRPPQTLRVTSGKREIDADELENLRMLASSAVVAQVGLVLDGETLLELVRGFVGKGDFQHGLMSTARWIESVMTLLTQIEGSTALSPGTRESVRKLRLSAVVLWPECSWGEEAQRDQG